MVYCSGLESQCRNPQKTAETARFCGECGAQIAMFTQGSDVVDGPQVGTQLSRAAFIGQTAFIRSCADVLTLDDVAPIQAGGRRSGLLTYYIGTEHGPIKIGSARCVYTRLVGLQTANPEQLYIYATEEGGSAVERRRHLQFSNARLLGEWFARTDELLRHIICLQNAEIERLKAYADD